MAIAAIIALAACGDEPSITAAPARATDGVVSRIDGTVLDEEKLNRLRAIGEGCVFTVKEVSGLYRRVAVKRSQLPFDLPPINKNPVTHLGDGKLMFATMSPDAGIGAVGVTCIVPGTLSIDAFGRALVQSFGSKRWDSLGAALARKRAYLEEQLDQPLSPEAREFAYELAPSVYHPAAATVRAPVRSSATAALANSGDLPQGCHWGAMTIRAGSEIAYVTDADFDCACRPTYTYDMQNGAFLGEEAECFWFLMIGGAVDSWPPPAPNWPPSPAPLGFPSELDRGGYTPPPERCEEPPPDEIPEDSLGRQYLTDECGEEIEKYSIEVACSPTTTMRGAWVTCTATPGNGGWYMELDGWGFTPASGLSGPLWFVNHSATWRGPVAASGGVSASGAVNNRWTGGGPAPFAAHCQAIRVDLGRLVSQPQRAAGQCRKHRAGAGLWTRGRELPAGGLHRTSWHPPRLDSAERGAPAGV